MRNHRFFIFSDGAIKRCMALDCELHGMIAHIIMETALKEGTVEEHFTYDTIYISDVLSQASPGQYLYRWSGPED